MDKAILVPLTGVTYRISYVKDGDGIECDFGKQLIASQQQEAKGNIEKACNIRFEAFQNLMELIPDSTDLELDWEDEDTRSALLIISFSAIDHFLVGDFEMCAAMLEMLLELDPEDHLEASRMLAYTYIALEEYDSFDEVINDISDKCVDKEILLLWSEFRRNGSFPDGDFRRFVKKFFIYYQEFIAEEHPVTDEYLREIEKDRPAPSALARELWLQTEHLWELHPEFISALKAKKL